MMHAYEANLLTMKSSKIMSLVDEFVPAIEREIIRNANDSKFSLTLDLQSDAYKGFFDSTHRLYGQDKNLELYLIDRGYSVTRDGMKLIISWSSK